MRDILMLVIDAVRFTQVVPRFGIIGLDIRDASLTLRFAVTYLLI